MQILVTMESKRDRMRPNHNKRIRPVVVVEGTATTNQYWPCRIRLQQKRRCIIMAISILSLAPIFFFSKGEYLLPKRNHRFLLLEGETFHRKDNDNDASQYYSIDHNHATGRNHSIVKNNNNQSVLTIFYNLYLPRNDNASSTLATNDTTTHTIMRIMKEIVQDQIDQIGTSCRTSSNSKSKQQHCVIRYVSIGVPVDDDMIQEYCSPYEPYLTCIPDAYYEQGFEEVTLNRLWQYCQDTADPAEERVVYLHNKGSYHAEQPMVRLEKEEPHSILQNNLHVLYMCVAFL